MKQMITLLKLQLSSISTNYPLSCSVFMQPDSPRILTLRLNEEAFSFFNSLRITYFPPERNVLSAHLTLFHHLPANETKIEEDALRLSQAQTVFTLRVAGIVSIGKGVAYKLESSALLKIHGDLQKRWQAYLTPQDKQKLWPHVTVQNKVAPMLAKQTLEGLKPSFQPFNAYGLGLELWSYEGGPWKFLQYFPFAEQVYTF
jgi:2'-5' RNA ligase